MFGKDPIEAINNNMLIKVYISRVVDSFNLPRIVITKIFPDKRRVTEVLSIQDAEDMFDQLDQELTGVYLDMEKMVKKKPIKRR